MRAADRFSAVHVHESKNSKLVTSILLIVLMLGMHTCVLAAQLKPREIYHRAWALVRDNYFDPTFNGVDWSSFEHKFDDRIRTEADAEKYTREMLWTLKDPSTGFLNRKALEDNRSKRLARIVGIGINLKSMNNDLVVTRTVVSGPAELAGVKAGDVIVAINGASSIGITPEQAAQRIRGEVGKSVDLSLKRVGTEKELQVKIPRREITIASVSTKLLDDLGYIQVVTLESNDTAREFRQALRKFASAKGLIIDLRNNSGGLLANSLDIADMLLERGPICSTFGRKVRHTDISTGAPLTHQPIVVLIDRETSSQAEILAAALKDNGRAAVVGEPTGGRGMYVETFDVTEGVGLQVSVGKFITPAGSELNKIGIQPDVTVKNLAPISDGSTLRPMRATKAPDPSISKIDAQLASAVTVLKERITKLPSSSE